MVEFYAGSRPTHKMVSEAERVLAADSDLCVAADANVWEGRAAIRGRSCGLLTNETLRSRENRLPIEKAAAPAQVKLSR